MSVKKVEISKICDKTFFISSYQRGYRWERERIKELLEDLKEFKENNAELLENKEISTEKFYCLQPLIVKEMSRKEKMNLKQIENMEEIGENRAIYEVIDGQQRLTTIYILLKYLNAERTYSIFYQTRGNKYLDNITEEEKEKYIDNFYIYEAKEEIREWFEENKKQDINILRDIKEILLNYAKILWYEVDNKENSIDVFTRINTGKIPLTNAELIKALLLKENMGENREKTYLKQLEIANEWDKIESELQKDEFWYVFNNYNSKKYSTRIELLFELSIEDYDIKNEKLEENSYETFNYFYEKYKKKTGSAFLEEIWDKKVRRNYMLLKEWYEDKELYHLIGFLIAKDEKKDVRETLKELIKLVSENTKKDFKKKLNDIVKEEIRF